MTFLDWICTLRIIDDTYPSPGFTVNVFSNTLEELPQIKNHDDMILFTRIKVQRLCLHFLPCAFDFCGGKVWIFVFVDANF